MQPGERIAGALKGSCLDGWPLEEHEDIDDSAWDWVRNHKSDTAHERCRLGSETHPICLGH